MNGFALLAGFGAIVSGVLAVADPGALRKPDGCDRAFTAAAAVCVGLLLICGATA